MDFRALQNFLCLVRVRNFSRAARESNLTQSALSRRMKALEEWVGAPLLDRSAQPVALTRIGATFFELATEFEERFTIFRQLAAHEQSEKSRTITIAAIHTLAMGILPSVVMNLEQALPGTLCIVSANDHQRCIDLLASGEADLMFSFSVSSLDRFEGLDETNSVTIGHDVLIPVSGADDRGQPVYSLSSDRGDMAQGAENANAETPFLSYGDDAMLQRGLEAELGERFQRCRLRTVFKNSMTEVLRRCVQAGFGMAWLPQSMVADDLRRSTLVAAGGPEWHVPMEIRAWRRTSIRAPLIDEAWSAILAGAISDAANA